jgi:hypothetical protein
MSHLKPDGERVNRNAMAFGWTKLAPEGLTGPPPPLPDWREWHTETLVWWCNLWNCPQSSQWDATGRSLHLLAALTDDLISGRAGARQVSPEVRAHEASHGLSPRSMLALRWRVVDDEPPADEDRVAESVQRQRRMRVI